MDVFDERCKNDPQGVIKDLLGQITRQGKEIHDCCQTLKERDAEIVKLNKKIAKWEIPFDPD